MYTASQNITPVVINDFVSDVADINYNFNQMATAINTSAANIQQATDYNEYYLDVKLKEYEERIANKMYNIISEIIETNMTKEEFIKLLLSDEMSDA